MQCRARGMLHMHTCMCHTQTKTHTHTSIHACTHSPSWARPRAHASNHACLRAHIHHTRVWTRPHVCMCVCIQVCVCTHKYVHIRVHIRMYAYECIYICSAHARMCNIHTYMGHMYMCVRACMYACINLYQCKHMHKSSSFAWLNEV